MAHEDELRQEKTNRLDSVPDAFIISIQKFEGDLHDALIKELGTLTYKDGKLFLSDANLRAIGVIANKLNNTIFGGKYLSDVKDFIMEMAEQGKITDQYFALHFDNFEAKPIFKDILKESQRQTLKLMDEDAIAKVLIDPLREKLTSSVSTGASFADTVDTISNFIEGTGDTEGVLTRHMKRVAYDSFAITDRNYTAVIAGALDLEWYLYSGGVLTDSREFCREHHGHYYHKKEIELWADGDWQGKNPATNKQTIFSYAGGFNCRHSFMPVSESIISEEVLKRVRDKGFIK